MGTIICVKCQRIIDFFDHIKVTTLYSNHCECCHKEENSSSNA
ncbi:GapA-binding peptide SR1P [Piscibacillus halophilus]|nr:GapA-binding peptide SR1P [Piscibacillus halophilus]